MRMANTLENRPYKDRTAELAPLVLKAMKEKGYSLSRACASVGIGVYTMNLWARHNGITLQKLPKNKRGPRFWNP